MKYPVVSVILTHQLKNNWPYLKLAIEGLLCTRGIDFEAFIISGQEEAFQEDQLEFLEKLPPHFHFKQDHLLNTATKKFDAAFKEISTYSSHILLLSDDVIVSGSCIPRMYEAFCDREMIMGPMSNSDMGSRYDASMELMAEKLLLRPDMSLDDLNNHQVLEILRMRVSNHLNRLLIPFHWISFFCVMMPKTVWQKLNGLDAELEYRYNDHDFCMRAAALGIPSVVNFAAFAFHFGSKTMHYLKTDEIDRKATEHFTKKWMGR